MMSGSFSPPPDSPPMAVPGSSSSSSPSHSASSSPSGAGEYHQHHHQQGSQRRRQRGPRVRTASDLSAMMMMPKVPSEDSTIGVNTDHNTALAEGFGAMSLSSSSSDNGDGLNGRTATRTTTRSSQATVKHTTVSTEDFGRIASPALQLRRMKRRLLLEAVGQPYSNCDSIRNGGGSSSSSRRYFNNHAHNMIDRQDSDISSSSTLTSVSEA